MTPQSHSTPLFVEEMSEKGVRRFSSVGWQCLAYNENSPISLRLEKPAVMGACLGDFPRLGALDDHTLHPSPSDFNLQTDAVP